MALPGRRILILYGSETGNSQEKAGEIDRMCQRLRFHTELEDMDSVKLNTLLLGHDLVVFVISTTGQGQFPRNARGFWKSLRRAKLPPNCLASVRFTTFGLGDSSYQKFNWASRLLHSRLLRLGAQEAFPPGEADERHDNGIDSIYQPWVQKLKDYLLSTFPLPAFIQPIPDTERLLPRYSLRVLPKNVSNSGPQMALGAAEIASDGKAAEDERKFQATKEMNGILDKANIPKDAPEKYLIHPRPSTNTPPDIPSYGSMPIPFAFAATVSRNERVTPVDHWQDVRLLTLEVTIPIVNNEIQAAFPGDVVVLYPKNCPEDVQKLIDMMNWSEVADNTVAFSKQRMPKDLYPRRDATLRDVLTDNIDFTAVPTRMFLEKLAEFTTHPDQKEKLLELIRPQFSQEFYDFTSRPRRTILEVLAEFYTAKVPVANVPDIFPIIRGREYSIANGGQHRDEQIVHYTHSEPFSPLSTQSSSLCSSESTAPLDNKKSMTRRGDSSESASANTVTGLLSYTFDLLIALVEYKTIIRKPREGLCSRYVKNLPVGTPLVVTRRHDVRPPIGGEHPMIAIATGTGIAPIRSLIQERITHSPVAETLLFFGCRNEKADFYFRSEWENTPKLTVVPAFSRDPKSMTKIEQVLDKEIGNTTVGLPPLSYNYDQGKTYVQHMVRQHAKKVCELLGKGAFICLCGSSGRMPKSVREALRDAVIMGGLCNNTAEADRFLFDERNPERVIFWEETW